MAEKTTLWGVVSDVLRASVVTLVVLLASISIEHNRWMEGFRYLAYQYLQHSVTNDKDSEASQVLVLDISQVPELEPIDPPASGHGLHLTPRKPLMKLLNRLAEASAPPSAIAVDIDFSSMPAPQHKDDIAFFQFCKRLSQSTPIFLGVGRSVLEPPWLGEDFKSLVGSIHVLHNDPRHAVHSIHRSGDEASLIYNLPVRLAIALRKAKTRSVPDNLSWTVNQQLTTTVGPEGEASIRYYPVMYGQADNVLKSSVRLQSVDDQLPDVGGKAIFIGSFSGPDQRVLPTGDVGRMIPGTVFHALSYLSLVQKPPLELSHTARIVLDLLLVGSGIIVVALVRLYYLRKVARPVHFHRLESFWYALVGFVVLAISAILVGRFRIIWDDFLWCSLLLFLHPTLDRVFWPAVTRLFTSGKQFWENLLFAHEGKTE